jgi:osmotically-inducible protein OsmY
MISNPTLLGAALLVAGAAGACAGIRPDNVEAGDARIQTELVARLAADADTSPFTIDIDVSAGVVHLTGVVDSDAEREEAGRIAGSIDGVRQVVNDVRLAEPTAGEELDDAAITARVKAKIAASSRLNPFDIQVNTVQGEVSLTGRVHDGTERDEAERLARETDGVRGVRNLLEVGDLT